MNFPVLEPGFRLVKERNLYSVLKGSDSDHSHNEAESNHIITRDQIWTVLFPSSSQPPRYVPSKLISLTWLADFQHTFLLSRGRENDYWNVTFFNQNERSGMKEHDWKKTWEGTFEHVCNQVLIKGSSMDKEIETLPQREFFRLKMFLLEEDTCERVKRIGFKWR